MNHVQLMQVLIDPFVEAAEQGAGAIVTLELQLVIDDCQLRHRLPIEVAAEVFEGSVDVARSVNSTVDAHGNVVDGYVEIAGTATQTALDLVGHEPHAVLAGILQVACEHKLHLE